MAWKFPRLMNCFSYLQRLTDTNSGHAEVDEITVSNNERVEVGWAN